MEFIQLYSSTVLALGLMALLMLCQVIVADAVGLKMKHLPGSVVPADHNNVLFRVNRTVANTNETVAIFVLVSLFAMLSQANPDSTAYAAWAYVIARFLYALCYYMNLQALRSTMFGVSLLALATLLVLGGLNWF